MEPERTAETDSPSELADAIAVVGWSGRFPGAAGVEELWENLLAGVESVTTFSEEELADDGVPAQLLARPDYVRAGAVLDGIEELDAAFFGLSPREAELMDPQHRLFLEQAWCALEDAGYDPRRFPGRIGVWGGTGASAYLVRHLAGQPGLLDGPGALPAVIGNDKDFLTSRVAYKLHLTGPAITVQTACSTSLVAVCTACQSLLDGECDMALAGGVTVRLPHRAGYLYQEEGILSPDGHCRAFDAEARGTVPGSGVALVVLRRLADALADGDPVRAVIRGWAVNNDGGHKVGYTAPSVDGQAAVVVEALAMAGVEPAAIGYLEAHGTGTRLGDPIEVAALARAFGPGEGRRAPCWIGSVKTHLGHLDGAAGVTGLLEAALAAGRGRIPGSLHFQAPNPEIDLAATPFRVVAETTDWPRDGNPRRAGVSSFGIGGTNAHVVVEEPPAPLPRAGEREPSRHLLVVSARSETALDAACRRLADHLEAHPELPLADVAWTLQAGRAAFTHRRAVVAGEREAALAALRGTAAGACDGVAPDAPPPVAFLIPGQGAQHGGMAAALYRELPRFREELDAACASLEPRLGLDLLPLLLAVGEEREAAGRRLQETALAQPALFAVEHALARTWIAWGIEPAALLGHSVGELVAACLAGVFRLEDALALAALRGRAMQSCPPGTMLAVGLGEDELLPLLPAGVVLAAVNAPRQVTASGPSDVVAALERELAARGVPCRRLRTSHAFHSPAMEQAAAELEGAVAGVARRPPAIPFLSGVTGNWITPEEATDPAYWGRQLLSPVRFAAGAATLLGQEGVLLEVGPGETLAALMRQQPEARGRVVVAAAPPPDRPETALDAVYGAMAALWVAGAPLAWEALHRGEARRRVPLPTYPFERQRYWIEPTAMAPAAAPVIHKRADPAEWLYTPSWRRALPAIESASALRAPAEASPEATDPPDTWLLFADSAGLAEGLAATLEEAGAEVVTVHPGEGCRRDTARRWELDPAAPEAYDELLAAVREALPGALRIAHLWSVREPAVDAAAAPLAFEEAQRLGFGSLLRLAQALGRQVHGERIEIVVVGNGLCEVLGDDAGAPERSTVLGLARVVPQEYPNLRCRAVDLPWRLGEAASWGRRLAAELAAREREPLVALRGEHCWEQMWSPLPEQRQGAAARLRRGGHYLVTGGLGRFGLLVAGRLAREWEAQLTLVDLRPSSDPASATRLAALQESGARALVIEADAADPGALAAAIAAGEKAHGPLQGAFHAAGISGEAAYRTLAETDLAAAELHLHPLARGALALAEALGDRRLDFCLLASSLAPVLGGVGLGAFAAAGSFLDAFAPWVSRRTGSPWTSVDWEGWGELWEQEGHQVLGREQTELMLADGEVAEVVERLLVGSPPPVVAVATGDLPARLAQWTRLEAAAPRPAADAVRRPGAPPYEAPAGEVEEAVAAIWSEALGVADVGRHDDFFELGGNSLIGLQILSRLRGAFEVELPLRSFFEARTVARMAEEIERERALGGEEAAQLEALLAEIEGLSEEELERELVAGGGGSATEGEAAPSGDGATTGDPTTENRAGVAGEGAAGGTAGGSGAAPADEPARGSQGEPHRGANGRSLEIEP